MPASSAPCALFAPGCDESSNSCGVELAAAIGHVQQQRAVATRGIGGPQDHDVGGGFHLAVRIARCLREIGDDGIAVVGGIEGDGGARGDPLIGADVAKAAPGEGGHALHDIEADDFSLQRGW